MSTLQQAIQKTNGDIRKWILASGFDASRLIDGWLNLTITDFDELFNNSDPNLQNPIYVLSGSGHISYANRRVLELAEIPLSHPPLVQGGKLATFFSGRLQGLTSGVVVEFPAQQIVSEVIPEDSFPPVLIFENLKQLFSDALAKGNTFLNDAGLGMVLGVGPESDLVKAVLDHAPRLGSATYVDEWANKPPCDLITTDPDTSNPLYLKQAVKLFADGSNQGATGLQCCPYTPWAQQQTQQDYMGADVEGNEDCSVDTLAKLIAFADHKGWQVMIHANGDRAIKNALAAYQQARDLDSLTPSLRHRIEHCSILQDSELQQMVALQVSPSFLMEHATVWGNVLGQLLGSDRVQLLDRCNSVSKTNLPFSLHSDYTVTKMEPLARIQAAVTRVTHASDGTPYVLNPNECIPVDLALKAQTIYPAWQCHADQLVGSLEVGKLADLVVLGQDPHRVDPSQISSIPITQTWVNGKKRFPKQ